MVLAKDDFKEVSNLCGYTEGHENTSGHSEIQIEILEEYEFGLILGKPDINE